MADTHAELPDAGRIPHDEIDNAIQRLRRAPIAIFGARDDPEDVLHDLLIALERLGFIRDGTTET